VNLGELRSEATAIFRAAVDAVQPDALVRSALRRSGNSAVATAPGLPPQYLPLPLTVIGAGKAAAAMALGCEEALGAANVAGEVVAPDGTGAPLASIRLHHAGHPLPDQRGFEAARSLLQRAHAATGHLLCLLSGGASSLLVHPRPPLSLADKIETNRLLLQCGAAIEELNTVRKHLSEVKGGGILRHTAGEVVSLLISDVAGDDPATIASGPTVADPTTFADAWNVIRKHGLEQRLPPGVAHLLRAGLEGKLIETVKPGSPEARRSLHTVIGSNSAALRGAAAEAGRRGWETDLRAQPITGDTTAAAHTFGRSLRQLASETPGRKLCVLAGGETTVVVRGGGRGGRNQEFALALADELAGTRILVLSAGTDGIDGPTDAAGAFVDGETLERARRNGLNAQAALANNDSYTFFSELGSLLICGPTGTNVMDVKIALLAGE
jgi:hydroxypyruvate reductase